MVWEGGVMGDGVMRGGCWGMVLWKEGVVGGGCYGGWCCGRRVLGDGVVGGGCYGDGVGGGCYGGWCCGRRVLGDGVMGGGFYGGWCCGRRVLGDGVEGGGDDVMDNTSEPTNIFRSDFWGLFSPLLSLSPISSFSYLNSMYMYMCTSPFSPLAPSDVSSPLVVMATSSSITVTGGGGGGGGGLSSPAGGYLLRREHCSPDHDLQHAGTTETVVTGLPHIWSTYLYM